MNDYSPNPCQECGEDLFELNGEFYCPSCDSVSGFELVPDEEQFTL
jgi:uncharacterized Zn finger protein (UPF0148 family)